MKISKAISVSLVAVSLAALSMQTAAAQSTADRQLKGIQNQNSASQYSSQNFRNQAYRQALPRTGLVNSNLNQYAFGQGGRSQVASKPFAGVSNGPNVSPYLGLDRPFGGIQDYYTLVRPQLEAQRNRQQQAQLQHRQAVQQRAMNQQIMSQHRLNRMAARAPYDISGSEQFAPTGHAAVFQNSSGTTMNTSGYFPPPTGL